ncbi:hypothetical protein HYW21_04825 [Candidatus Woesearchaeota archaeon]|nr:hypothetical protein [Candidatus Woesearchaeota archaeon]
MRDFAYYLKNGSVKKQKPDAHLSKATFKESCERFALATNLWGREKPKYVLENAYEAMREAADAVLYEEGFKSYSHEASIVYLLKKGFSQQEVSEFDRFRKIRNSIKYYGGDCDPVDAQQAILLAKSLIPKIQKLLS